MALSWTMTLKDKVSGPAGAASRAMSVLEHQMKATARADKMLGRIGGGVRAIGRDASKAAGALGRGFESIGTALAPVALAGLGAGAVGAFKLGSEIAGAKAFKNDTMFAFEQILGSKQAAADAFAIAQKTAIDTGSDFRVSMRNMNTLLAQGFDVKFADQLQRQMADLATVNPQVKTENLTRAISQIKNTGRLQADELLQLADAGLSTEKVYEGIAKSMKITAKDGVSANEQVRKLIEGGKVDSKTAIDAITAAMSAAAGGKPAGALAAAKAATSMSAAFNRGKGAAEKWAAALNIDFSPISRGVGKLIDLLESPAGAKFSAQLEKSMNAAIAVLDDISPEDLESALDGVTSTLKTLHSMVSTTADTIGSLVSAYNQADAAFQNVTGVSMFSAALAALEGTARVTQTLLITIPSAVLGAWGTLGDGISALGAEVAEAATALGTAIVDGLVSGIESGAGQAIGALSGIVGQAIAAGHEAADTGSPSKETIALGQDMGRGLPIGMDREMSSATRAGEQMAAAPLEAGRKLSRMITNNTTNTSSSSTRGNHFAPGAFQINAIDPAQALEAALRQAVIAA